MSAFRIVDNLWGTGSRAGPIGTAGSLAGSLKPACAQGMSEGTCDSFCATPSRLRGVSEKVSPPRLRACRIGGEPAGSGRGAPSLNIGAGTEAYPVPKAIGKDSSRPKYLGDAIP